MELYHRFVSEMRMNKICNVIMCLCIAGRIFMLYNGMRFTFTVLSGGMNDRNIAWK